MHNYVNWCIQQKTIPYKSTLARLIIFNKISGIPTPENTRPIASLSPLIKIFELLIKAKIQKVIKNNKNVSKN